MKRHPAAGWYILGVLLAAHFCTAEILFNDTFNRTDSTDIDALATGISGTLAPLAYVGPLKVPGSRRPFKSCRISSMWQWGPA